MYYACIIYYHLYELSLCPIFFLLLRSNSVGPTGTACRSLMASLIAWLKRAAIGTRQHEVESLQLRGTYPLRTSLISLKAKALNPCELPCS